MLKRFDTRPKESPPAGTPALAAFGKLVKGRLTRLPPSGSPVAAEIGKSCERFRPGLFGVRFFTPTGSRGAKEPPGSTTPVKAGAEPAVWKPWPISVELPL